ncbi:MAG: GUN4 domain-containing protein [Cyanobacteria bacterium J06638_28]
MAQGNLSLAETVKPASVILQVVERQLSFDDRDKAVRGFWERIVKLDVTKPNNIAPLVDNRSTDHWLGLQVVLEEPDQTSLLVQAISTHLEASPVEVRLTLILHWVRLQVQTASAEEVLSLMPVLPTLMPAQQIFQARTTTYVMRGGELSPVEHANLELLRHYLDLSPETAENLIKQALGPYESRRAKLDKYREVLIAELDRQSPLSETTWAELKQLYQNLGLSYEDVAPIDQEYISRIQAEVTRLQMEAEATRLQQATESEPAVEEPAENIQQTHLNVYGQEFQSAIARTLYPSEFDRGRLEQTRRLWELDAEVVRALERDLTDAQYGSIESAVGLDYSRLRQLLWLQQWEAADKETERLILTTLSRDMHPLVDSNVILQLNCVDLQTIDALWAKYSQGQFGFFAQYQVYMQYERRADDCLRALGWQNSVGIGDVSLLTRRKSYRDLQFSLEAPVGHLPTWRWGSESLEGNYAVNEMMVDSFFLHLEKCMPSAASTIAVETPEGA